MPSSLLFLSPRAKLRMCKKEISASRETRENELNPSNWARITIVSIGNQRPMLHRFSNPESLIEAEISVIPMNPDARFTPLSPIFEFTRNRSTDESDK